MLQSSKRLGFPLFLRAGECVDFLCCGRPPDLKAGRSQESDAPVEFRELAGRSTFPRLFCWYLSTEKLGNAGFLAMNAKNAIALHFFAIAATAVISHIEKAFQASSPNNFPAGPLGRLFFRRRKGHSSAVGPSQT